jgi:GntR family transcriptional regulator
MSGNEKRGRESRVVAEAGVPLHRQLFLVLHDEIARGVISPGESLPSEQSLCEQFGVSRITVRRALADLADRGYLERRKGVGSFVRERDPCASPPPARSYMDGLRQTQFETEAEVVDIGRRVPPRAITDKVPFTGDALYVLRLRRERRTGEPLIVTEAWLPLEFADIINDDTFAHTPLYGILSDAGITVDRIELEITAEMAGPRTAQLLDTAIGAPLLRINRVSYAAGSAHHFLTGLFSPNRSRILVSQSLDDQDNDDGMVIAHDVRRSTET